MQVNRPFPDTRMFGDIIDGDPAITPALKQLSSGIEDALGAECPFIKIRRWIKSESVDLVI
jgi:hypothetical protein